MGKSKISGIWRKMDLFSPPMVRVLASHNKFGHAESMTDQDLSDASGLSVDRIQEIYWSKNWDGITCDEMKRFVIAAGIDFGNPAQMKLASKKLNPDRKFKWRHLKNSKNHKLFTELLKFALS